LSRRQARWAERLAIFDFIIEYRKGASNPSDGPSRRPDYEQSASMEEDGNIMLPTLQKKLQGSFAMSSKEPIAGMLNACRQQLATNSAGVTPPWCAIRRKGSPQELGVGRPPSIGNSHFPWRPDAPSNGRAGRMFQRMRGGAVSKGPARCTHTGTSMISSHQAVRKTDTGTSDMYPIRAAFQSLGNLEPRALGAGTARVKQRKRPASRKLGGDRSKPLDFRSQGGNDGKAAGTGGLEHLVPRCVAMRAMSTETAYDEPAESMQDLLLALQSGDAWTANLKETDAAGKTRAGK